MNDGEQHIGRLRVARRLVSLGLGVFLVLLLPTVPADFVDATDLGDCFGGVLADDPLNCYVLEQAQKWDVMDIEGLYHAKGAPLYVYLTGENDLSDLDSNFLKRRAVKFAKRQPDLAITDDHTEIYEHCLAHYWRHNILNSDGSTLWCLLYPVNEYDPLPYSPNYIQIRVRGADGDADGRGKSGLHKVWPIEVGPKQKFDVSDVDLVNLPAYVCLSDLELISEERLAGTEIEIHPTPNFCDVRGRFDADHLAVGIAVGDNPSRDIDRAVMLSAVGVSIDVEQFERIVSTFQETCEFGVTVCTQIWNETTQKYEAVATVDAGESDGLVHLHGRLAEYAASVGHQPMRVTDDLNDHLNEVLTLIADSVADETGASQVDVELRTRGWENWFEYAVTEADSQTVSGEVAHSSSPIAGVSQHYDVGGMNSTDAVKIAALTEIYEDVKPVTYRFRPTKYSDLDVYRWTNSLNAYAQSESNTVGILKASTVGTRNRWPKQVEYEEVMLNVDLCENPATNDACADTNFVWSDVSTMIEIEAYDAELLMNALPELLPRLGIPHEAVGTIRELEKVEPPFHYMYVFIYAASRRTVFPDPPLRRWANSVGVPNWVPYPTLLVATATVLLMFLAGAISLLVVLTVEAFKLTRCRCSDCFEPSSRVGGGFPPTQSMLKAVSSRWHHSRANVAILTGPVMRDMRRRTHARNQ